MRALRVIGYRLRSLVSGDRLDHEAREEIAAHLERQIAANRATGMSDDEARRAALLDVGQVARLGEECRDARGLAWWDALRSDTRYAVRQMRKRPGFSAAAVVTLALGVGATAAVFAVVDTVLLGPLPYTAPDRLYTLYEIGASRGRLVRQLATEGLVLFVIGGALGLTLAAWGVAALASELPATLPRAAEISVDWRFVAFGAALTLTSGLLFSVLPALSIARRGPASGLAGARGTVSAGRAVQRTRGILIAAQIAAAVVLLAGAALALRSFDRVRQADKGFETDRTMTFGFVMRDRSFPQAAHMKDFAGRVRGGASGRAGCRSRRAHDPSAAGRQQSRKHLYRRRFARRGGTGSADCGRARRERPLSHGHRRAAAAGARPVAD
jgi:FtsX-like permease family